MAGNLSHIRLNKRYMNTPTHIAVACTLLSRPLPIEPHERRIGVKANSAVIVGALLPDLSIFVFFIWAQFFTTADFETIWGTLYWTQPWQTFSAISNSIPLMLAITAIAWWKKSRIFLVLALAMLAHAGLDFPVHADDAHKHFWPLSNMRFHSPLSYWDINHHAQWVSLVELAILVGAAATMIRRFKSIWVRILAATPVLIHIAGLILISI